jgi:hypothetical protein
MDQGGSKMKITIKILSGVCAVFLGTASENHPSKAQVLGLRGIDHVGLTVPNLREAVDFFVNVLGCEDFFSNDGARDVVGILRGAVSGKLMVLDQAARSIG